MRICFIVPCDLSQESGGKTHTLEFAENWSSFGHEVFLLARGLKNKNNTFVYVNVPVISIRYLRELSFAVASAIMLAILHCRFHFDVIYQRLSVFDWSILTGRLFRVPLVAELNDVPFSEVYKKRMLQERTPYKRFMFGCVRIFLKFNEFLILNSCWRFVGTTQNIKGIESYPSIEDRIVFVPFAANTQLFRPIEKPLCREQIGVSQDVKLICFVGSFLPWQGVEDMVEAFSLAVRRIPHIKLLIIGDINPEFKGGPKLKRNLVTMIKRLGLESKVIFAGRVPYERVPIYINASDVCIVAQTRSRSGYSPLKLFEYMACGKPLVATDVDGIREVVRESNCGVLVPPQDTVKLADAILKLLKNANLMTRFGENGLRCVTEKYTWESLARKTLEVCDEATQQTSIRMS